MTKKSIKKWAGGPRRKQLTLTSYEASAISWLERYVNVNRDGKWAERREEILNTLEGDVRKLAEEILEEARKK